MSSIGERLRAARERKHLSQVQVKERTGINNKTLSGYENGVSEPDAETMARLADLYEVSIHWLVTGNESDTSSGIPTEEQEFLEWMKNVDEAFFYDFHKSPEEQKKQFLETMRALWEVEKKRGNIKPRE